MAVLSIEWYIVSEDTLFVAAVFCSLSNIMKRKRSET